MRADTETITLPARSTWRARVLATIGIGSLADATLLRRAVERELRETKEQPERSRLLEYRAHIDALFKRNALEDWGWE